MKMKNRIPKSYREKTVVDERQQLISLKACLAGFIFLLVCLVVATVYDIAKYGEPGWEIWGIVGACVAVVIANRKLGNVEQPKDIFNRPLPTGKTKPERKKRIIAYALDSILFGSIFAGMEVLLFVGAEEEMFDMYIVESILPNLGETGLIVATAVFTFATMFLISFVCEYLVGEFYKVRRYNKMLSELDDDEDDE